MCGIAGIWELDGRAVSVPGLKRFTRTLAHRGPDGEGFHTDNDGALGLGHRRLSILDLTTAGKQPMSYADERYWVTFNGEIYNFLELRRELQADGYVFRTRTDTEIIPAAFDRWGPDCQLRFDGMWAFALWDRRERALFLSRDRFGVKPLFYTQQSTRFAFASEMKAFRQLGGFVVRSNNIALHRVLADNFALEGTEETLLQDVRRLGAGHCALVRCDGMKTWRWWDTLDHLARPARPLRDQAEEFKSLFFDACRLRLRSDVPVATTLSGGLDSSSVLCTMAKLYGAEHGRPTEERQARNWQRAFVATFPGTPLDEREYADIAIQHCGAEAHYVDMSPQDAGDELNRLVYDLEDIHFTSPFPIWSIYRALRADGVVVSIDGHGADEMLGGYRHHTHIALTTLGAFNLLRAPLRTLDLAHTLRQIKTPLNDVTRANSWRAVLGTALNADPAWRSLRRARRLLPGRARNPTEHPHDCKIWLRPLASNDCPPVCATAPPIDGFSPLNAHLYHEFHHTILPTVLRVIDRCSMAHGVEVRMPFLDWRLVCHAFALPETSKIGGGYTKRILREAMRGVLPEALRTRRHKIGFNSPLRNWFNGPLRDWLWQQVNEPEFLDSEVWDGPAVRAFVATKRRTGNWSWADGERVWPYLQSHTWSKLLAAR